MLLARWGAILVRRDRLLDIFFLGLLDQGDWRRLCVNGSHCGARCDPMDEAWRSLKALHLQTIKRCNATSLAKINQWYSDNEADGQSDQSRMPTEGYSVSRGERLPLPRNAILLVNDTANTSQKWHEFLDSCTGMY